MPARLSQVIVRRLCISVARARQGSPLTHSYPVAPPSPVSRPFLMLTFLLAFWLPFFLFLFLLFPSSTFYPRISFPDPILRHDISQPLLHGSRTSTFRHPITPQNPLPSLQHFSHLYLSLLQHLARSELAQITEYIRLRLCGY